MTNVCPALEFPAGAHLTKLQGLQNKSPPPILNFQSRTPIRDLHMALRR
jgi:hypothetical protein